jgi:hypothetical protein
LNSKKACGIITSPVTKIIDFERCPRTLHRREAS